MWSTLLVIYGLLCCISRHTRTEVGRRVNFCVEMGVMDRCSVMQHSLWNTTEVAILCSP